MEWKRLADDRLFSSECSESLPTICAGINRRRHVGQFLLRLFFIGSLQDCLLKILFVYGMKIIMTP